MPKRPIHKLPKRKKEILDLLGQGLQFNDVARELYIETRTVRSHMEQAREMTGARTTMQMVALWFSWKAASNLEGASNLSEGDPACHFKV